MARHPHGVIGAGYILVSTRLPESMTGPSSPHRIRRSRRSADGWAAGAGPAACIRTAAILQWVTAPCALFGSRWTSLRCGAWPRFRKRSMPQLIDLSFDYPRHEGPTMRPLLGFSLLLGVIAAVGCAGSNDGSIAVSGTGTLDDEPLTGAAVNFTPEGETKGHRGIGGSGPDGKYTIMGPQGQQGLVAGTYKVTVSKMLRKDGTAPPPGVPPIASDASDRLPQKYSNLERTQLRVTVDVVKPYDLRLVSDQKQ